MSSGAENQYRGEAGHAYQQKKRAIPPTALPWIARSRGKKFQKHIKPPDTVLEVGAGFGWNLADLKCARRMGSDVENFFPPEISNVEFVSSTQSLGKDSIDVLICHHVLEHVENPTEMLGEIRRLLKPDGRLLLNVPFERERRYRTFDPAEPNHHLYSWNAQSLGNLLTLMGFAIQEIGLGEFGYDRAAASAAVRFGLGERGFLFLRLLAHLYRPAREVFAVAAKKSGWRSP